MTRAPISMRDVTSAAARVPSADHSADSAVSACAASAPRSIRSRTCAGVAMAAPGGSSPSAASRDAAPTPIALATSGRASSGKPPTASTPRHAQRPLGLGAQLGSALARIEGRIGDGREVRRPVQHARLSLRHQRSSRSPPSAAWRDSSRGRSPRPRARRPRRAFVALGLLRERLAVEIEHGQHADAAVAAGARLDQQRPLAMARLQVLGDRLPPPTGCAARRRPPPASSPACARSWRRGRTAS